MKRYLTSIIFTLAIVGFYSCTDIRFFSLNVAKMTRENLFSLRMTPAIDEDIILLNIGKLKSGKIPEIVDSILQLNPKIIGINLCHYGAVL